MSLQDDAQATVTAAQAVLTEVSNTAPSAADDVLEVVIEALEAQGYTVTAPAPADAPELPASDSSDTTS